VWKSLNEAGEPANKEQFDKNSKEFLEELEWYAQALKAKRG
jgi:ABC-type Zn uptake system ZnuABC Zn-binding protein ZnuA